MLLDTCFSVPSPLENFAFPWKKSADANASQVLIWIVNYKQVR